MLIYRMLQLSKHILNLCLALLSVLVLSSESTQLVEFGDLKIKVDKHEVSIQQYKDFLLRSNYITSFDANISAYEYAFELQKWDTLAFSGNWIDYMSKFEDQLPVTMVSIEDACTYCEAKGGRLPTSEEWIFYSGTTIVKGNIWHGIFPFKDYGNDGYGNCLSPVGTMTPLISGLHDIYGNVWEYTQSKGDKAIAKGGSYMCDFSMCSETKGKGHLELPRDRIQPNLGFRCVYDVDIIDFNIGIE